MNEFEKPSGPWSLTKEAAKEVDSHRPAKTVETPTVEVMVQKYFGEINSIIKRISAKSQIGGERTVDLKKSEITISLIRPDQSNQLHQEIENALLEINHVLKENAVEAQFAVVQEGDALKVMVQR